MTLELLGAWAGLLGGITGVISLCFSVYQLRRDAARERIDFLVRVFPRETGILAPGLGIYIVNLSAFQLSIERVSIAFGDGEPVELRVNFINGSTSTILNPRLPLYLAVMNSELIRKIAMRSPVGVHFETSCGTKHLHKCDVQHLMKSADPKMSLAKSQK